MPDYTGGYTSAVNDAKRREYQDAGIKDMLAAIAAQQWREQQFEQTKAQQKMLDAAKVDAARQLQAPPQPQPMAPGQPSVPMQQGPMPQGGLPPQLQALLQGGMAPGGGGGAMPAAPSGGAASMPPPGPPTAPQAGPAPTGTSPVPQGFTPIAGGQFAPPIGGAAPAGQGNAIGAPPPLPGEEGPILPPKLQTMESALKIVDKINVPDNIKGQLLDHLAEQMDKQNKIALQKYRDDAYVKEQATRAAAEARAQLEERRKIAATKDEIKVGSEIVTRQYSPQTGQMEMIARAPNAALLRAQAVGAAGQGGYGTQYEKLDPKQQATVDWYATMQLAGDNTWRVGLSRTRGGSDLIKAVDERVPDRAQELGLSAADIGTNKAIRVSTQAALTQNTKDIAMLQPYVAMLDQNAEITKKLAEKAIATHAALANKPLNWLRVNAADSPDVAEYLAQIEIVKNEATRVISNPRLVGQMTDTARQEIESVINGSMPLNATERVLDRLKNDGERRIGTMQAQQQQLQGTLKEMFPSGAAGGWAAPAAGVPKPGEVRKGYRFKGGDPAKQENWEKVS